MAYIVNLTDDELIAHLEREAAQMAVENVVEDAVARAHRQYAIRWLAPDAIDMDEFALMVRDVIDRVRNKQARVIPAAG